MDFDRFLILKNNVTITFDEIPFKDSVKDKWIK